MGYTHFYHKGSPRNMSESPDPNLSIVGNTNTDASIVASNTNNINFLLASAGAGVITVGRSVLNATGDEQLKRNVSGLSATAGLLIATAQFGLSKTLIGAGVIGTTKIITSGIEQFEQRENERYTLSLRGARVKGYNNGVDYND